MHLYKCKNILYVSTFLCYYNINSFDLGLRNLHYSIKVKTFKVNNKDKYETEVITLTLFKAFLSQLWYNKSLLAVKNMCDRCGILQKQMAADSLAEDQLTTN